ncbi:hypothetical protein MTBBW1_1090005 [Desulfamplus magnetovallimortis]|uniref:GLUG domain-containing protein n=1 Tax=Desulfamplus magnetovallimortis TaxID=1246637 RepID=A0A1W1H5J4_9BACT|nr:hypothetical protein MTBBW1_1090005 [Desulfamplus magnetovallimortis]
MAGYFGNATVDNCYTTGNISVSLTNSNSSSVGGFIADNNGTANIINSYSRVNVTYGGTTLGTKIGSFFGSNDGNTTSNCYATGNITWTGGGDLDYVGGFVGRSLKGFSNCYTTGDVAGKQAGRVGGFVGEMAGGTITNGYWNSDASQTIDGTPRDAAGKKGVGTGTDNTTSLTNAQMAGSSGSANALVDTLNTNKGDSNPTWYSLGAGFRCK